MQRYAVAKRMTGDRGRMPSIEIKGAQRLAAASGEASPVADREEIIDTEIETELFGVAHAVFAERIHTIGDFGGLNWGKDRHEWAPVVVRVSQRGLDTLVGGIAVRKRLGGL